MGRALDYAASNVPQGTSSKRNITIGKLNLILSKLLPLLAKACALSLCLRAVAHSPWIHTHAHTPSPDRCLDEPVCWCAVVL